jgi:2-desacetyl-2-hydroxyethyl bacteriochlorophyllide A dehydrogenase
MQAATQIVFERRGEVGLVASPVPTHVTGYEVLLRTECSLISPGTELAVLRGTHTGFATPDHPFARFPHRPGYSAVGRVEAAGSDVKGLFPGDRIVAWAPHASHVVVDTVKTAFARLPANVPSDEAALASLGAIALHGLRRSYLGMGDAGFVLGLGLVGLLTVQLATAAGVRPLAGADVIPNRLAKARELGLALALDASDATFVERARAAMGGEGARAVIDSTGNPGAAASALRIAARDGRVVLLGSPHGLVELDLYSDVHARGVSLVGAHGSTMPAAPLPGNPWTLAANWRLVVDLLSDGTLSAAPLISHRIPYSDAPRFYERLSKDPRGQLGVVVMWDQPR